MTSVAGRLDVPGHVDTLGLPEGRRYVVFLVDGLGLQLLREHPREAPFLNGLAAIDDVVAGVPSTTATSLTSLGTGLDAGRHGVVGYTSRVPETGERINSLQWDAAVDPSVWQPHPAVLRQVQGAGLDAWCVNDERFERSGLTLCSQRGVPFHGFRSPWERLDVVLDTVDEMAAGALYAYESRIDHTGHGHGTRSQDWRDELRGIDAELAELRAELPSDTVLVVTADHGMVDVPVDDRFDVDDYPRLLDGVSLLAGEARFRHLYAEPGAAADVAARWRSELGERAVVRLREDGLDDWFGPVDERVAPRIGDVVVAALDDFAVFSRREFAVELSLRGMHGSVTEAELQIPLLLAP